MSMAKWLSSEEADDTQLKMVSNEIIAGVKSSVWLLASNETFLEYVMSIVLY